MNHQIQITIDGISYLTLDDILPIEGKLKGLIVGKTPSPKSIYSAHFFHGKRGQWFWKQLRLLRIIDYPEGNEADDYALKAGFGVTHISKLSREFIPTTNQDVKKGYDDLISKIERYRPKVVIFTYKSTLDLLLSALSNNKIKTNYGFNPQCDSIFHTAVFVFPMPGTICKKEEAKIYMADLVRFWSKSC